MQRETLEGRVALVTGSSRGIGRAIAIRLAEDGADVVVNYVRDREAGLAVVKLIESTGRRAQLAQCDVTDSIQVATMVENAIREFGKVDILVSNAGVGTPYPITETTDEAFQHVIDVNMKGLMSLARAVVPSMKRNEYGRIIAISSVTGQSGKAFLSPSPVYAAAKAGIIGMVKGLAREGGPFGITANAICPGWTETEATSRAPEAVRRGAIEQIPLGRTGRPEDISGAASYLASSDASYVTGITLSVNGGLLIS